MKNLTINVGDYVRTIEGYICKILEIHEEYDDEYLDWNDIHSASIRKSHIIKSSPNIIDLIEVGDYVNGWRVNKIEKDFDYLELGDENKTVAYRMNYDKYTLKTEFIKSIVTKEQMEAMEYKIEGL